MIHVSESEGARGWTLGWPVSHSSAAGHPRRGLHHPLTLAAHVRRVKAFWKMLFKCNAVVITESRFLKIIL